MHPRFILLAALPVLLPVVAMAQDDSPDFNPKDIDQLLMFVESVRGMSVATNDSADVYRLNTELVGIEKVWSDQQRFPHGTVRWWEDQSPYRRAEKLLERKPLTAFKTGRDFGQDDHDRPGFTPDGCNGKPCARGGLIPADAKSASDQLHHKQPCYFEIQYGQGYSEDVPFGVFLLARPVKQEQDFVYFGAHFWSTLVHRVGDNSLAFRNGGRDWQPVTGPDAVPIGKWQLIEVHRNHEDQLRVVVNGQDVTRGSPTFDGDFRLTFLMNNNKGQQVPQPMAGDVAAFIAYGKQLSDREQSQVRVYLNSIYRFLPEQ